MNLATLIVSVISVAGIVLGVNGPTASSRDARGLASAAPCTADSGYRRLAFWVGEWTVYDSTGKRYASQRVRDIVDQCAVTAEWTGTVGDKGLSIFAYDANAGGWKQMYVSNQVPRPSGVILRRSDPDYHGPGVRFIALAAPPSGTTRSRVTILPLPDGGVRQMFEDSRDDGTTWTTLFKAEHRPAK